MDALLDHIQSFLTRARLPVDLTVNLIASQPKRTNSLFPYFVNAPKITFQECLLTFSATLEDVDSNHGLQPSTKSIMVSAYEIHIYTIPSTDSTLLYISKVDSTGYSPWRHGIEKSPPTIPPFSKLALKAFLSYFLSPASRPTRRVYVQLFARSQNQYLFPNSIQGGAKRVLGGTRLCRWWKNFLEELVVEVAKEDEKEDNKSIGTSKEDEGVVASSPLRQTRGSRSLKFLAYFLPSYERLEAKSLLGSSKNALPTGVEWAYLPPNHPSLASPLRPILSQETRISLLSMLVPSFSDDPKARFLLDLIQDYEGSEQNAKRPRPRADDRASESSEEVANPKKRRLGGGSSASDVQVIKEKFKEEKKDMLEEDEKRLQTVSFDEFWERMGFRQECVSGDVTGFFTLGVCEEVDDPEPTQATKNSTPSSSLANIGHSTGTVTHAVYSRVMETLLNHDFGSLDLALESTQQLLKLTEATMKRESGDEEWDRYCMRHIVKDDSAKADYISRSNVPPPVIAAPITMLAVRKKPKNPQT